MMSREYHVPVMLQECIEGLNIDPNGIYVDVTYGGGGHSNAILEKLDNGKLIAFDQDQDAVKQVKDHENLIFVNHNFQYFKNFLKYLEEYPVDGILADLGISSHQIDKGSRGFSFRFDADLDMRMDYGHGLTAGDFVNQADEEELLQVFRAYGELKNARRVVGRIIASRSSKPIQTTKEMADLLSDLVPDKVQNKFLAQVFQALRIHVNGEMEVLREMLCSCVEAIKPGGRLVVMSYHSLEDRMVKNLIQKGSVDGAQEPDEFGRVYLPFKAVNRKVVTAGQEELSRNPRARSAKLRIAIKQEWKTKSEI
jgi:16S rRNA (cytosine1402-N4)-methyltransferase